MERVVTIQRDRKTNTYILNPMGSFKGYGGLVGINPYRELPANVAPVVLGDAAVVLLEASGPTGYSIKDMKSYRAATEDAETMRIREQYFSGKLSTAVLAKRFARAELSWKSGQKSWSVQRFEYDSARDVDKPGAAVIRVKTADGPEVLGRAIHAALSPTSLG